MDIKRSLADRCQSCGMPLKTGDKHDKSFYGTEVDGSLSDSYCRYCYVDGAFTEPEMTLDGMIESSVGHMTRVLKMPMEKAKEAARKVIPMLGRWKK